MRRFPAARLAALAAATTLLLAGCAGSGLGFSGGESASTAAYVKPALKLAKPAPWDQPLTVKVSKGLFSSVIVTDTATHLQLIGSLDSAKSVWTSDSRPSSGSTYAVQAVVVDETRASTLSATAQVATQPASALMKFGFQPAYNQVVGVNAPIVIRFAHKVTDRAAVEKALTVSTTTPVVGSWHWISSSELHFRPQTEWAAHSTVRVQGSFDGLQMSDTRYGGKDVDYSFKVGDKHETIVNDKTHTFVYKVNGVVKYTWQTSLGKAQYETRTGNYIVLEKDKLREMTSCAAKITCDKTDPQYYDLQVQWDTRLSWSGTFIHGAPWDSHLGLADVSHGCIHLTLANAETYYNLAQYGDIVHVLHTSRTIDDLITAQDPGASDWNSSWASWVSGSALGQPVTTQPLTTA
jgi:lipoprotein-anchoring transpeptidase ErfK/SrfK